MTAPVITIEPVNLEGLRGYKAKNPVKFKHKYGDLDVDNVPEGFEIPLYKMMVVQERTRRTKYNLPQDIPAITPWTFVPKVEQVVEEPKVETVVETNVNGGNTLIVETKTNE